MNQKAILAISFGTSHNDTRAMTIDRIEADLLNAFPGYALRRAFTSPTIRRILFSRDGERIDDVSTALARLAQDGYTDVICQPTYVICGMEYDETMRAIRANRENFERLWAGVPLLQKESGYEELVDALLPKLPRVPGTAHLLMGHGTEHPANASYPLLQELFFARGRDDVIVGTVEGRPDLEEALALVKGKPEIRKVRLAPLMIVAGDHAKNDLAGDGADSWKSVFTEAGYEVSAALRGLGEYKSVRDILIRHAKESVLMKA